MFKMVLERDGSKRRDRLAVLLETHGGYVEEAERIVNILRHHYTTVDFVVSSFAMSAGTVLVMSGDDIYMDYSAALGPIDPQVGRQDNPMPVPALGYLEQYDRLIERSAKGLLTSAELAYLIQKFDPAELYQYEQARELSTALLEEWLARYKFKNWTTTETQGKKVTPAKRKRRAQEIAKSLNDTKKWHSHSRGISMAIARSELQLQINDIAGSPGLEEALADYTDLLYDYRVTRNHHFALINWAHGYHGHGYHRPA